MAEPRFRRLDTTAAFGDDEEVCFLEDFVDGIDLESWRVLEGAPLGDLFPKDARIHMSPNHRGAGLADLIGNTIGMLLVSEPFKEAMARHCKDVEVEYLPVTIHDHRKRPHGKGYFIVNPVGTFDCLDLEKSVVERDEDDPGEVLHVADVALDRKKTKNAPQLFRVDKCPSTYVIGPEVARAILELRPTNVYWAELRFGDEEHPPVRTATPAFPHRR